MPRTSPWIRPRAPRRAWAVAAAVVTLGLGGGTARAEECWNPCEVGDRDLCAPMKQVIELGRSIAVRPGRQSGTCGGVVPLAAADLTLTWSRDPAGPFTPVPVTRRGDELMIKPDRAGAYFLEVAARGGAGAPDRLVIVVVERTTPAVELRLRPDQDLPAASTAVKLRWVPPSGLDRFPRRRWPVWRDNDAAGLAERPLRLPPGRYDVEWTNRQGGRTRTGVTTIDVTGPGRVDVALTAAPARAVAPPPAPAPKRR